MKKLIFTICLIVLCASTAYSIPRSSDRDERGAYTGPRSGLDQDSNIKASLDRMHAEVGIPRIVWFVDSNESTGVEDGKSWTTATDTWNEAVDLASAGDTIYIRDVHTENWAAISGVSLDVAGIHTKGFGRGSRKPTFTITAATGSATVSAVGNWLENLRFVTSVTGVISGLNITGGGSDTHVTNCDFIQDTDALTVDEFLCALHVTHGADNVYIAHNWFNAGPAQANSGISYQGVSGILIEHNDIIGDYAIACVDNGPSASVIGGTGAVFAQEAIIRHNLLFNGTMSGDGEIGTIAAVNTIDGSSGLIAHNDVVSDVNTALLMLVSNDYVRMSNIVTDDDVDTTSGSPEYGWIYDSSNRGTATTSISPHVDG